MMNRNKAEHIKNKIIHLTEVGLMNGWGELKYVDLRLFDLLENWEGDFPSFKKTILKDKSFTEARDLPWDQIYIYYEGLTNEHELLSSAKVRELQTENQTSRETHRPIHWW